MKTFPMVLMSLMLAISTQAFTPPSLKAMFNGSRKTVQVSWLHNRNDVRTYILQRSVNSVEWMDVAKQESPEIAHAYSFEDPWPMDGENLYRLKTVFSSGKESFSENMTVSTSENGYRWSMYPVPVTNMLTLAYKGNATIKGVINVMLQRVDGNGMVLGKYRFASSTKQIKIPVNNLGRGLYDVKIVVDNEVIWSQRFVK